MARASRVKRFHAQTKRENTLLKREVMALQIDRAKTIGALLAVLSQVGGTIEITNATVETVNQTIQSLGFTAEPSAHGLTMRLVSQGEPVIAESKIII